jgi:hypothetical protein
LADLQLLLWLVCQRSPVYGEEKEQEPPRLAQQEQSSTAKKQKRLGLSNGIFLLAPTQFSHYLPTHLS